MRNLQEEGRRPGNDTGTKVSIPALPLPSWMTLSLTLPVYKMGITIAPPYTE